MFFFKRKFEEPFPFHRLKTDYHSHIIPGIDDGAPDTEASVTLIKGLIELGYENFIGTPHVMEDIWENTTITITAAHQQLQEALKTAGINKQVRPAAEYLVDSNFEQMIHEKQQLLTIKDNWVLFEISFVQPPMQLRDIVFELQMQGYQPVFAHPERYSYYHTNQEELQELKSAGCLFQSNILSFSGYYGPDVLKASERLAKNNLVDLLGTDIHHERHLDALRTLPLTDALGSVLTSFGV